MATETERRILERVEAMLQEIRKDMATKADLIELREHLEGKIADVAADVQALRRAFPPIS